MKITVKTMSNVEVKWMWIITVSFLLLACQSKESRKEFLAVPIESRSHSYNSDFYLISVEYPIEQWDYDSQIKRFIDETVAFYKRDWSSGGMQYEDEMLLRELYPDRDSVKFELNIRFEKFTSTQLSTHSYVFFLYVYTGGANGMTTVASFNFNENGIITQSQVFQLNSLQEIQLTRLIAHKASTMTDVFNKQLVWDGLGLNYLKPDGVTIDTTKCDCTRFRFKDNFKTFVMVDEGVHFYFDKYKISNGSIGTPSVHLEWQQLIPYVNKQFATIK